MGVDLAHSGPGQLSVMVRDLLGLPGGQRPAVVRSSRDDLFRSQSPVGQHDSVDGRPTHPVVAAERGGGVILPVQAPGQNTGVDDGL